MMLLAVALALQTHAAQLDERPGPADSAATQKFLVKVRRAETKFIIEWRREWERNRVWDPTGAKFSSLHCHFDDFTEQTSLHLIRSIGRKSMCPIWHEGDDSTLADEALSIDNGLRAKGREPIRRKRAEVLALLDSAATIAPDVGWVLDQRVRLYVDQREFDRAETVATDECHLTTAYCALLAGYVLLSRGEKHAASAAFDRSVALMSALDRCRYLDIRVFLQSEDQDLIDEAPCDVRAAIDARFWWLADPLFMQPANERLAVHLYREVLVRLHAELNPDERFDWRLRYGGTAPAEMILRYGWPALSFWDRVEDDNHFGWMGFKDSSVNASREYLLPRFHTTPTYASAVDIAKLEPDEFGEMTPRQLKNGAWDDGWWPIEHFARDGTLSPLDYQEVVVRRATGPVVAVATEVPTSLVPDQLLHSYTAGLVAMRTPTDTARRRSQHLNADSRRIALTVDAHPGLQIVSAEVLDVDRDSAPAGRARFSIDAPPGLGALLSRDIDVSEAGLFAAPDTGLALPRSFDEGVARMLPTSDLHNVKRLGVFFEIYGVAPGEPVDLTLRVVQEDRPGFLRRIGGRLGIADAGQASILMHWRDNYSGIVSSASMIGSVPVQWRSIVIDLSQVKSGHYALEIGAARPGESPVVSRRQLTIRN
jgi:hypothetical protein